jgi:hypothetical protein
MICNICGSRIFGIIEYRQGGHAAPRAPAFECRGCGAISLGEEAAASDEERESVRVAIARRAHVTEDRRAPATDWRRSVTSTARLKVP